MELFLPKVDSAIDGQFYNIDNIVNENIDVYDEYTNELTIEGFVTLQSFYSKILDTQLEMRPSLDFDLQLLDTSTANKNTLASILLDMETSLIANASRTLPGLIQFALETDYQKYDCTY